MNPKKLKYELDEGVVNTLLRVLDRSQIVGVQNAQNLISIVNILQNPLNAEELEKDTFNRLKSKFEPAKAEEKEEEKKIPKEK